MQHIDEEELVVESTVLKDDEDDNDLVDKEETFHGNDKTDNKMIMIIQDEDKTEKNDVVTREDDHDAKDDHWKNNMKDDEETQKPSFEDDDDDDDSPVLHFGPKKLSTAFYCPITKELCQDPVVASNGITYERHAILERNGEKSNSSPDDDKKEDSVYPYYPNRALQQVLAERLSLEGGQGGDEDESMRSKLVRLQRNVKSQLGRMLEPVLVVASSTTISARHTLPEAYYCPITFGLIHDPVIDPEGNTFELRAIQLWVCANHTSPLSRKPLQESELYDNLALQQILHEEADCSDDSIHPSIRKWKDEPTPERLPPEEV